MLKQILTVMGWLFSLIINPAFSSPCDTIKPEETSNKRYFQAQKYAVDTPDMSPLRTDLIIRTRKTILKGVPKVVVESLPKTMIDDITFNNDDRFEIHAQKLENLGDQILKNFISIKSLQSKPLNVYRNLAYKCFDRAASNLYEACNNLNYNVVDRIRYSTLCAQLLIKSAQTMVFMEDKTLCTGMNEYLHDDHYECKFNYYDMVNDLTAVARSEISQYLHSKYDEYDEMDDPDDETLKQQFYILKALQNKAQVYMNRVTHECTAF